MALNNKCPNCGSTSVYVVDGPYFNDQDECFCTRSCDSCGDAWKEYYSVKLKTIEKEIQNG